MPLSAEPSPPVQPPQMSPDRKWIWDGAQWRPIAVHEAAFPSWQSVGAGFTPLDAAPVRAPVRAGVRDAPAVDAYRLAGPAPGISVPLWNQKPARRGVKVYGRAIVGLAGLVIVVALVSVVGTLALSNRQSPPAPQAQATPTAGPDAR